jgi:hypothetical protein
LETALRWIGAKRVARAAATARGESEAKNSGGGPDIGQAHSAGGALKKSLKPAVRRQTGARSTTRASFERAARLRAVRDYPLDQSLSKPPRSPNWAADATARAGRQPDSIRLSTIDGAAAARRVGGERQTSVSALPGRTTAGANQETNQTYGTNAYFAGGSHSSEPTLEHGFCE